MRITKLAVTNVRGVTDSWEFGPAAMIIGDNYAGKSAVLYAIRLAIFGWLPHPRKDAEMPPMRLASGDTMTISIALDNGQVIERTWKRDAKGSVSAASNPKDIDLAPAIMLDPKQYFDASPAKRMKFVFDSVRLLESDFSMQSILAEVKNIKLEQNTEATEKALKDAVNTITAGVAAVPPPAPGVPLSIQDIVDAILTTCTDKQKLAKQSVDRMSKTVAGLTELELRKPEQFDEEIGDVDAQLRSKRDEVDKWNSESGRLDGELNTVTKRMDQRRRAEDIIATEPKLISDLEDLQERHKTAMDELDKPAQDFSAKKSALVARRIKAKQDYDEVLARISSRKDSISEARTAVASADSAKSVAEKQMLEVAAEMDKDLASPCCPTCDAPGQEWRDRVKQKYGARILDLSNSIAASKDAALKWETKKSSDGQKLAMAQDAAKTAESVIGGIDQELRELVAAESQQQLKQQALHSMATTFELKAKTLGQNKQSIAEARQYLDTFPAADSTALTARKANVGAKLMTLRSVIRELEQKRTQIVAQKANAASQVQAVLEREKAQAELDIWKETIKVVTGFQKKMVDAAFGSMMAVANRFSDGILDSPLEYRDGEVGRNRAGRWVPQDQFSDAEQIVTYAAMSIALAASAPFRVVLIDELTRVRGTRKTLILNRMLELIADGTIDQFVAVDVQTDDGQVPDYYLNDKVSIIHIK